jgi:hypothetical protein
MKALLAAPRIDDFSATAFFEAVINTGCMLPSLRFQPVTR